MKYQLRNWALPLLVTLFAMTSGAAAETWWGSGSESRGWEAQQGWEGDIGWGDSQGAASWGGGRAPYAGGYGSNGARGYYEGGYGTPEQANYGANGDNRVPPGWMPPPYGPYRPATPYPVIEPASAAAPVAGVSPGGSH